MNIAFRASVGTVTQNQPNSKPSIDNSKNVTRTLNRNNADRVLLDKNYGALQTRNLKVAFRGLPAPLGPQGPSLGQKVMGLLDTLHSNEVILVGSNLKKSLKDLEKHIDKIDKDKKTVSPFRKVIKKIFFLKEPKAEQTIAFTKNEGDREFTNLSDKLAFVKTGEQGQKYFVKPNDTIYVSDNDILLTNNHSLKFDNKNKAVPNNIKEKYATIIDVQNETENSIKRINKNTLKKYSYEPNNGKPPIKFADIGGMKDAIRDMKETIVYPIKYPELKSQKNMNKAVLLEGPPGTGKSLLGEATANESGAYYRYIKGSELDGKYVGESEANVRAVVAEARDNQPAIIFIDEIDAIGKKRSGKDVYGDKALNTWLAEMSESEKRGDDIYFVAATNNKEVLDSALTRAGRFGKIIHIGEPDLEGTKQIFDIHRKGVPFDEHFNVEKYSKELHKNKAVGADISAAVEDAEKFAKRREGIYEKIDAGTYTPDDMKNLRVKDEDFDKAIEELTKRKELTGGKQTLEIGFNSKRYHE